MPNREASDQHDERRKRQHTGNGQFGFLKKQRARETIDVRDDDQEEYVSCECRDPIAVPIDGTQAGKASDVRLIQMKRAKTREGVPHIHETFV